MLPFSKRPPPPEEYFLRSGDFEAVPPQGYASQAPVSVPAAPRAPVFARHAAPTPYGFSQNQPQPYGYADLSAPPPPHSLAPVAMISERSNTGPVGSTARRAQTVVLREKPSLKWGVMIALTGALLGGVLGLGMDAKRQQDRAAAASEARDTAPAAATPTLPVQVAVNGLAAPAALPVGTTLAGNGAVVVAVAAPPPAALRAPVVLAPPAPVIVTAAPKNEPPAKPEKHAKAAPAPAKHPSFVAAKVSAPKPPPPEKPEPAPAKADKPSKDPPKAGSSDARKVLEDAIKDTTNTL
ncbi:MAG TPA: hypothetical protein VLT33_22305 [Labilithrix sp.]|nr:hypothetical protein [Labilithrix sp.]